MTWWLVPSILGVVVVGIITGLLISRQVIRTQKKSFTLLRKQPLLTAGILAGGSVFEASTTAESLPEVDLPVVRKTLADLPGDERLTVYLDMNKNSSTVKTPLSPALLELQNNLSIAKRPVTNNLVNFQTDLWNNQRSEFNGISQALMGELTEAYVDMTLANNIVWLVMELGRDSQDLKDSHINLRKKVAERLQRIIPAARDSFQ